MLASISRSTKGVGAAAMMDSLISGTNYFFFQTEILETYRDKTMCNNEPLLCCCQME
jgi:hypothetical protein